MICPDLKAICHYDHLRDCRSCVRACSGWNRFKLHTTTPSRFKLHTTTSTPLYHNTTTPHYHDTTTQSHHYTTTPRHHITTTPPHNHTTILPHHHTIHQSSSHLLTAPLRLLGSTTRPLPFHRPLITVAKALINEPFIEELLVLISRMCSSFIT